MLTLGRDSDGHGGFGEQTRDETAYVLAAERCAVLKLELFESAEVLLVFTGLDLCRVGPALAE